MAFNSLLVPDLSSAQWATWQPLREQFEAAWRRGERPDLDQFLPPSAPLWQIVDLGAIDLEMRLKAGEPARVEQYLERYPKLGDNGDALAELATVEYEQRRRREEVATEDYVKRFPALSISGTWPPKPISTAVPSQGRPQDVRATTAADWPQSFDHYEVEGAINRGGMGVILRCRDTILNRPIAVKTLRQEHLGSAEFRRRLQKEAQITSQLQHPGIPPVHEVGKLPDGRPYFAMKLIEGHELGAMLRGRASKAEDLPRYLAIFQQICQALAYTHQAGVIHRDLKPANVMVGAFGEVQVMDWGLAKILTEDAEPEDTSPVQQSSAGQRLRSMQTDPEAAMHTEAGSVLGTLPYMPREQALGQAADRRSDVFGLGAILCEILTGKPPYRGTSVEERLRQASAAATDEAFADLDGSGLDAQLITLAKSCLSKEREQRPGDAGVVAEEVTEYLNGVQQKLRDAEVERARAEAKADTEAKARAALEEQLYANRIAVAERELTLDQDVGLASELLSQCPEQLRGWEWDYLMHLRDGDREPITGHDGGLWGASFSPDGRLIATASIDGTARIWEAASGRLLLTFKGHAIKLPWLLRLVLPAPRVPVMCVAFSPDGRFAASGSLAPNFTGWKNLKDLRNPRKARGVVHIWDVETGRIAVTFDKQTGIVDTLAWSPDGTRVASSSISEEHGFAVWDARTGESLGLLRGHANHVHKVRFSPDGRWIVSGSTDGVVKLWDTGTLKEAMSLNAHHAPVYDLSFSPDSQRLASASCDGTVCIWQTATGAPELTLRGHTGAAFGVVFSPDARRIATAGWDKSVRLWDATTGVEKITLRRHTDMVMSVAFDPGGRQLVSASFDKQVRVWDASPIEEVTGPGLFALGGRADVDPRVNVVSFSGDGRFLASGGYDMIARLWDGQKGTLLRTLEGHKSALWGLALGPDGTRLATASWDRTAKVWDTQTGEELVTFKGHLTPLMGLAFSPDGKKVASCSFEGMVKIWDATTGKETAACAGHLFPAVAVAFSPDGRFLITGSGDRTVKMWDAQTGRELRTLKGHNGLVHGVAFSPDGRRVASASWDHTVKVWNASNGRELLSLKEHRDRVQSVAFSPDGTRIASASEDKTVRLWDVATGQQLLPVRRHRGIVCSVVFSPDGKRIATGCWSSASWVKTWDARCHQDGVLA
jgi:WD40 repeat protein/serine/threonine protein kinase